MAYSTPELQRVGTAQNLVLGEVKLPGLRDNIEPVSPFDYIEEPGPADEAEW